MNKIISYCKINRDSICVNDELISVNLTDTASLITYLIQTQNLDYPKLYKMDILSKMCILGVELLLQEKSIDHISAFDKSIILVNASSCYHADKAYLETMIDSPSPSKFVYTLPNIAIGEIAIKHKIKGFTNFMIADNFQPDFISEYLNYLLDSNTSESIIGGWVEVSEQNSDLFLFLCGKSNPGIDLTAENLNIKNNL